jgi:hypothetical protein
MKALVVVIVVVGVVACVGAAMAAGLDGTSGTMLGAIFVVGAVAIAGSRKTGSIQPARCAECGGLVSPNAPVCKHCGAELHPSADRD